MALEQYRRAVSHGVRFAWLTFDEGYGGKPAFLRALDGCGQNYVGEIPASFVGWTVPPEVLQRRLGREGKIGRPRQVPRLKVRHTPACEVRDLSKYSPLLRRQPWMKYRVKEGEKGPMVWEAKGLPLWIKDEAGLPVGPYHLLIARSVMNPEEVKFFLSNAPPTTSVEVLLRVAFSRWRIERMFEDSKGELGLDHFEVRKYPSIQRHLILTCISHLFLAEFCLERQKKRTGAHRLSGSSGHAELGPHLEPRRTVFPWTSRDHRGAIQVNASAKRSRSKKSPETNPPEIVGSRHQTQRLSDLSLAKEVAL
jgi:SRSO17 transposase